MRNWIWIIAGVWLLFGLFAKVDPPDDDDHSSMSYERRSSHSSETIKSPRSVSKTIQPAPLYVTGNRVNLRSGPGTSFRKVGQLNRGARVQQKTSTGGWIEISSSIGQGWMSSKYLSSRKPIAAPPSSPDSSPRIESRCHSSYSGKCVPIASDVDCAGGSGNGPAYVRGPVRVIGPDVYRLDRDKDGWGCE